MIGPFDEETQPLSVTNCRVYDPDSLPLRSEPLEHKKRPYDNALRGLIYGLLISIPVWIVIILGIVALVKHY